MDHGDFKDLSRGAAADKVLRDKAFNIEGCQRELASMVYKLFGKKTSGSGIENEKYSWKGINSNQLLKNLIKKVDSPFIMFGVQTWQICNW